MPHARAACSTLPCTTNRAREDGEGTLLEALDDELFGPAEAEAVSGNAGAGELIQVDDSLPHDGQIGAPPAGQTLAERKRNFRRSRKSRAVEDDDDESAPDAQPRDGVSPTPAHAEKPLAPSELPPGDKVLEPATPAKQSAKDRITMVCHVVCCQVPGGHCTQRCNQPSEP